MNKNDLVSIIIPIYNRIEIALKTSILSVFNQSHTNWELIIIDDGSTDAAREEIGLLMEKDKRIKYFYQENQGQSVARNLGIKIAKGDYVILLDSDDTLLSKNIETLLSILKKENLDYIYTHPYIFNYKKRGGGFLV